MKKTRNTLIISTKGSDEIELPVDYEDLIKLDEPLILPVKYKDNKVLALYDDIKKKIIVFDSEIIKD